MYGSPITTVWFGLITIPSQWDATIKQSVNITVSNEVLMLRGLRSDFYWYDIVHLAV